MRTRFLLLLFAGITLWIGLMGWVILTNVTCDVIEQRLEQENQI